MLNQFYQETKSLIAKKIINNFNQELGNFVQVCPIEMLDKIKNPISNKDLKSQSA